MSNLENINKEIEGLEKNLEDLKNIANSDQLNIEDVNEIQDKINNLKKQAYSKMTPWDKVNLARNPQRPTALDYIERIFAEFIELHGDRLSKDDKATVCGLAKIGNQKFTIVAQQKGRNTKENIERNFGMPNPESYRKGIRIMKQAEKFNRPIITFVDTKGAYPGIEAEERGQGEAIARSMLEMCRLKVPIIVIVIGEGSSGGALAISVGDKILMLENAVYSILSPEGYASILWKDGTKAKEAAEVMKLTAEDLYNFDIVDSIIKEPVGGASKDIDQVSESIKNEILKQLKELKKLNENDLVEKRYQKFRKIGEYIK